MFLTGTGDDGTLLIDNDGRQAGSESTGVEHIGRYEITAATDLLDGTWEIDTLPLTDVGFSFTETVNNGLGARIPFSVGRAQTLRMQISASGFTPHTYVFRDDGNLTDDDVVQNLTTNTNITFSIQPGDYLLVVGVWWANQPSDTRRNYTGTYTISLNTNAAPWLPTNLAFDFGLQGLLVDLDAADGVSTVYPIASNDGYRLIIATADDLSGVVGNELIGVHRFQRIESRNGASADFGGDRVEVVDLPGSVVEPGAVVNVGEDSDVGDPPDPPEEF